MMMEFNKVKIRANSVIKIELDGNGLDFSAPKGVLLDDFLRHTPTIIAKDKEIKELNTYVKAYVSTIEELEKLNASMLNIIKAVYAQNARKQSVSEDTIKEIEQIIIASEED